MYIGIGIAFVAGFVIGGLFGKTFAADAFQIKAHITNEIKSLEERIKARL